MNKSNDQNTEWASECISYVLIGCTHLFKLLNKMKVLGCTGFVFACLFLVLFWGAFSLLLFSGLKTSSKVFPVEKPRSLFFPLDDR